MRIGIVVDASCDLPQSFIGAHDIAIVPGTIHFGDRSATDLRDDEQTLEWYRRELLDRRPDVRTEAPRVDEIRELFLKDFVLRYDRVLMLCMSASRGRVFAHASQASYDVLSRYRTPRTAAGLEEPFALRVLDTRNVGPGEAILAIEAVRMLAAEAPPFEKLRRVIKDQTRRAVSYLVPDDLYFLRHRASEKGERSLSAWAYRRARWFDSKPLIEMRGGRSAVVDRARGFEAAVAAALERARHAIRVGHVRGTIAMSYGGELRQLRELPAYQDFEAFAARRQVELHLAVMSATVAVNVGPGAFALAWLED